MGTDFSSPETARIYQEGVTAEGLTLKPVILEVVGEVLNQKVADLGCGDGRYSIIFAESGAEVIGIDLSAHQLKTAREINSHPNITYFEGDTSNLIQIADRSIDLVFMNLLLPDLADKAMFEDLMREIKRVIKSDGRLVFSSMHPLYISSDQDNSDRATGFKKEDYFNEGHSYSSEAITNQGHNITFNETHFSLSYISRILTQNNFLIRSLTESKQAPEQGIYLPKYLIFECLPERKS